MLTGEDFIDQGGSTPQDYGLVDVPMATSTSTDGAIPAATSTSSTATTTATSNDATRNHNHNHNHNHNNATEDVMTHLEMTDMTSSISSTEVFDQINQSPMDSIPETRPSPPPSKAKSKSKLLAPDDGDNGDGNHYDDSRFTSPVRTGSTTAGFSPRSLTNEDVTTIQRLDEEYDQALLEREIGWNARYISVRQNAGLSIWFMVLFLTIGTIFFDYNTNWTLGESLLFSIYTITTVGYGFHEIPTSPSVLIFISVYIFIGIATLTILAAQLYQWAVLEITWARYEHDKQELTKRHAQNMQASGEIEGTDPASIMEQGGGGGDVSGAYSVKSCAASTLDHAVVLLNKIQNFVRDWPSGQLIVVMVPFWFLICLGAVVVGSIQEWSFVESMYFSVVSLTTVGFGDFVVDRPASTWFCIFWLPFSVFFVSLYLGSIASFYIGMSDKNVNRIEKKLRRRMHHVKSWQDKEKEEARKRGLSGGFGVSDENEVNDLPPHIQSPQKQGNRRGFASVSTDDDNDDNNDDNDNENQENRRDQILTNSGTVRKKSEVMKTMKDVIGAIKSNMSSSRRSINDDQSDILEDDSVTKRDMLNVHSTQYYHTKKGIAKRPTFALRVLIQERLAHIIALEVAGYQSNIEIKNNTLSITIDSLKQTCQKWFLPRRATKSFRSVAFETLYFVGERQLIVNGAAAVFALRPAEVQGLFGPVLAAMGDADTMEAWLNRTQMLAENEFKKQANSTDFKLNLVDDRRLNQVTQNMTSNPKHKRTVIGNAFTNK